MKNFKKADAYDLDSRKTCLEKQNRIIQKKTRTPEPSVLDSSAFSYDISLNSLSLKTESDDFKESSCHNFSSRSKIPSEVIYECIKSNFSERDQKILRLMAARREAKMKRDELAISAKIIWEEERQQRLKKEEEKKKSLMQYLAKKKRIEELEQSLRKNDQKEQLKQELMMLEQKIKEKHKKVEKRQQDIQNQKKAKPEILKIKAQISIHQELKNEKDREEEVEKTLHMQLVERKEKKTHENLKLLLMERRRKIKAESLKREHKWQAAKNLRDELNRKHEEKQIQKFRYCERSQAIREERRRCTTECKRKVILRKNEREKEQHALIYNRLKEEELLKLMQKKQEIQAKESRIKIFNEKREAAISRSRQNAKTSACLRQKMQSCYNL